MDRVPRQQLLLAGLRHHPHHPRPEDLLELRWDSQPGRAGVAVGHPAWTVRESNATPVEIRNRHSNLCLDDYNRGTTPGAEVRQWTCLNNNAQHWRIS
ncbi:RICIN domain-containing protein [Catellatospora aurea]|uniref:RICIN domain-containing protein n=1 Tax=Catellatospora aurea TaxID=1337874 RepID=A0ABW2GNZ0_9ACTN